MSRPTEEPGNVHPVNGIAIRPIEPEDLPAIARLAEEAFAATYPFDWNENAGGLLRASQTGSVVVLVAEAEGRVVGYCNLRAWPAGGWIDQVVVAGGRRRGGIGRALLESVVKAARKRGFWKVSLITSAADERALAFFRTCGWEEAGRMRDEIRRGTDGVLMSRIVDYELHPNP